MLYDKLTAKQETLAIIGLGYVGLPIALEFAHKINVIGFDINSDRIARLRKGIDPSGEMTPEKFQGCSITFTDDASKLQEATFYIVAVPTPIDRYNHPDLHALLSASQIVGKSIKKGDFVVYESTVYPGCTEEDCLPVLEQESGLKAETDFKIGYSPERINPGDKVHTLTNTVKIVSGCDEESLNLIARVYELIIQAGVHRAPSIKVAEAAKIIENTQRDVNIGLMNELSIIFSRIGINTYDVLDAAGTKWNFLRFNPGLVGGHCIGVDPYYLVHKAQELKYYPQIIGAGRYVNDSMGRYIAKQTVKRLIRQGKNILDSRVLVLGITFKENVADIRNSKSADIIAELKDYGVQVDLADPHAEPSEVLHAYNLSLIQDPFAGNPRPTYDAIVLAVAHNEYRNLSLKRIQQLLNQKGLLVDVKGLFRDSRHEIQYWSL